MMIYLYDVKLVLLYIDQTGSKEIPILVRFGVSAGHCYKIQARYYAKREDLPILISKVFYIIFMRLQIQSGHLPNWKVSKLSIGENFRLLYYLFNKKPFS